MNPVVKYTLLISAGFICLIVFFPNIIPAWLGVLGTLVVMVVLLIFGDVGDTDRWS